MRKATNNIFTVSLNEKLMFKQEKTTCANIIIINEFHSDTSLKHYEIITGFNGSCLQSVGVVMHVNEI